MENYIQNIELINEYLNKTLSEKEIQNFENRLKTEPDFNTLYDEHTIFLGGIKRQQLKGEIVKAEQIYTKIKWMRFLGISITVLTVAVIAYVLISNKSTEVFQNDDNEKSSIVSDSMSSIKEAKVRYKTERSLVVKDSVIKGLEVVSKTINKVSQVERPFKKESQNFKVNTEKDTTIVCKEGTKLTISANSFLDSKGHLVNGNFDLNVTEYYKLSDILLANLSTTSNGKQLETGGMLYINAFSDGALLTLNSVIEISFPTVNKKEGMQLFSGEWKNGIINWQLEDELIEEAIIDNTEIMEVEEIEVDVEVPFSVVEEVPIYPGCEKGSETQKRRCMSDAISRFVQRNFNTSIAQSLGIKGRLRVNSIFNINKFGNVSFIRSRGSHPKMEEEANRVISLIPKMKPGKQHGIAVAVPYSLPVIFEIPNDRQKVSVTFDSIDNKKLGFNNQADMDTLYTSVRGEVELIREVMHDKNFEVDSAFIKTWDTYSYKKLIRFFGGNNNRKVILRKPLFEMENARFKVLESDSISRGGHVVRKTWDESQIPTTSRIMRLVPQQQVYIGNEMVSEVGFENRLLDEGDVIITTDDVNNYILRTANLGWINCDRFRNSRESIKYKLKIENDRGVKVNMVFKSINSVFPSWRSGKVFDFRMVPRNEDIVLVAIKKDHGKLYLDIVETITQENPNIEFTFKEVSLDEMKRTLKKLF